MTQETRDNRENLELLLQASRLLSSKLELSELLTTVMEMASKVVHAESASILLVDPETGELYFDVALDMRQTARKVRLKPGQGIAGWCVQNARSAIVNDAPSDPRWSRSVDDKSGTKTRSILAAPMASKGKILGVVEAINKIGGGFTERDLSSFEGFASQCAVAIENARLFATVREQKDHLKAVFDTMEEGAAFTDPAGSLILVNESARRVLELQGRDVRAALASFKATPPLAAILAGESPSAAFELVRESPKRLILSGRALRLRSRADRPAEALFGWVWIFRDVTEERIEERLKRSFLSLVSHKLRTPLASIIGFSHLLLEDPKVKSVAEKPLTIIGRQGEKLSRLVDKLLHFVLLEGLAGQRPTRQPVSLDAAADDAFKEIDDLIAEKKPEIVRGTASAKVLASPELLRLVLSNLLENGLKFNSSPEPRLELSFEDLGPEVRVTVSDNGPGIPPEDQDKIFRKFFQVEEGFSGQVEGIGLGLPFSRKAVELHGGKLELDSKLGEGTRVRFTLPKAAL